MNILRIIYSRKLDVEPKPQSLTYLAHAGLNDGEGILSHYISTSGSSGFAHILKIKIEKAIRDITQTNFGTRQEKKSIHIYTIIVTICFGIDSSL